MADPIIRFAAPVYPGGRHCLLSGSVTVGAVFPPVGNNPGRNPWTWRLFSFGANPARDGRAKDETTAKGHLVEAFAKTLAEAGLQPIWPHRNIKWRGDVIAVVEDNEPQTGRDHA